MKQVKNFYKDKEFRQSDYQWFKKFRTETYYDTNKREEILARRTSFFSQLSRRQFTHNMIDGLCYGNFYGRQKILFARKDRKQATSLRVR